MLSESIGEYRTLSRTSVGGSDGLQKRRINTAFWLWVAEQTIIATFRPNITTINQFRILSECENSVER